MVKENTSHAYGKYVFSRIPSLNIYIYIYESHTYLEVFRLVFQDLNFKYFEVDILITLLIYFQVSLVLGRAPQLRQARGPSAAAMTAARGPGAPARGPGGAVNYIHVYHTISMYKSDSRGEGSKNRILGNYHCGRITT